MNFDAFQLRHIGPRGVHVDEMLQTIGVDSLEQLIDETVPSNIRLHQDLDLDEGLSEYEYARHIDSLGAKNKQYKSYIGQGYYGCIVPAVNQRNILENPGWYTAYTPYQAEIAQGRLEGLLNFQTMVSDLTGMEIANASLLDEGTGASEAMMMLFNTRSRAQAKAGINKFFISERCFAQTVDVVKTKATPLGIDVEVGNPDAFTPTEAYFGCLLQYPDSNGAIANKQALTEHAHEVGCKVIVATDLMALTLLTPPGEWGADVVVGNTQRFGVPMGYGGPHAGFFATREDFKRHIPGRIIGVSVDRQGNRALRMALQTREQHIRRDKATSNICTAQALLAIMAGMYVVYHGPHRIKAIAQRIHRTATTLETALAVLGYQQGSASYFDTLNLTLPAGLTAAQLRTEAEAAGINFRYISDDQIGISVDESVLLDDLNAVVAVCAKAAGKEAATITALGNDSKIGGDFARTSDYLTHPVFNSYQSETDMMRYLKKLENKDVSLTHSMISLGSCTMKLNAASELYPITNPAFCNLHPFVPVEQAGGFTEMINELERMLCTITGFDSISFQPNSGAQGEYTGLMVIRAFHESRGDHHRNITLIPSSAHGTNPASAVIAGMKVVVVKCDDMGNIDVDDLRAKAELHRDNLSALMVTYPSTHGVFEESIVEVTDIVHQNGGRVYMDGANMNAQVGLTNPATIGADVCHLNLHKTFAIPHGGGGPGMGPIGVTSELAPFLPGHPVIETGGSNAIGAIAAAPWSSALILLISYGYIKMLGKTGVTDSTIYAILNANYIKARLDGHYDVLYKGANDRIAHEMILDCRDFKRLAKVNVEDVAKRLIDYGFHAPTVSFPVAETLMVEPTESESKAELDRFCDAMISIREEVAAIENGTAHEEDNVVRNAPHTCEMIVTDEWDHSYGREAAAYPLAWTREAKFWPSVARIDNAYGDRNLICTCPPIEEYEAELV